MYLKRASNLLKASVIDFYEYGLGAHPLSLES